MTLHDAKWGIPAPSVTINADVVARYGEIKIAYLLAANIRVAATPPREKKLARQVEAELRASLAADNLEADAVLSSWLRLSQAMRIQSAADRPAQLQLISRILSARDIPKINNIVDAANITAAQYRSPVGVFDLDKLEGPIRLRLAQPDDVMIPLFAPSAVSLVSGEIVYSDNTGVFSRYSKDSDRTKIENETRNLFAVVDGTASVGAEYLATARDALAKLLEDVAGPDLMIRVGTATLE